MFSIQSQNVEDTDPVTFEYLINVYSKKFYFEFTPDSIIPILIQIHDTSKKSIKFYLSHNLPNDSVQSYLTRDKKSPIAKEKHFKLIFKYIDQNTIDTIKNYFPSDIEFSHTLWEGKKAINDIDDGISLALRMAYSYYLHLFNEPVIYEFTNNSIVIRLLHMFTFETNELAQKINLCKYSLINDEAYIVYYSGYIDKTLALNLIENLNTKIKVKKFDSVINKLNKIDLINEPLDCAGMDLKPILEYYNLGKYYVFRRDVSCTDPNKSLGRFMKLFRQIFAIKFKYDAR